jgi:hypothetical protein
VIRRSPHVAAFGNQESAEMAIISWPADNPGGGSSTGQAGSVFKLQIRCC